MPIGTVIIWPAAADPAEGTWVECNGQSTTAYPALAAIVGSTVPDYRGIFLRGYGSQLYSQLNGSLNGDTTTLHTSGTLGTIQGDATRSIIGSYTGKIENCYGNGAFASDPTFFSGQFDSNPTPVNYLNIMRFDSSRVVPTANENRPINKAVRYLIKAQ